MIFVDAIAWHGSKQPNYEEMKRTKQKKLKSENEVK